MTDTEQRIAEFRNFLCRFDITKFWMHNYGTVLFEPLAQHYGLETEWIDITNDLNVALFFATCREEGGEWYPLTKNEMDTKDDTKYGCIFHMPKYQNDTNKMLSYANKKVESENICIHNVIHPIGYQPFFA